MTITQDEAPLWHAALFHDGDEELVAVAEPYTREGLDLGEACAVALPPRQLELVRRSLGRDADHVLFVDVADLGRNPGRVLPELGSFRRAQEPTRRVRAFGTPVWPGRSPAELLACREHDALINLALADVPVSVLCPFDRTRLDAEVLDGARATHPWVCEGGRCDPSAGYADQHALLDATTARLPEPDDVGETLIYRAPDGPRSVRRAVASHARRCGLDDGASADLCLAVHEVAVNTVVHTSGTGILTMWVQDGAVVCQIQDGGWIRDPLVGRHPPHPADGRGYGLYLAHQLCDLVQVHSTRDDGTTVRLWMRLPDGLPSAP